MKGPFCDGCLNFGSWRCQFCFHELVDQEGKVAGSNWQQYKDREWYERREAQFIELKRLFE